MTKKQSSVLYGIAILLMMLHHLPASNVDYVPAFDFAGGGYYRTCSLMVWRYLHRHLCLYQRLRDVPQLAEE